MASAIESIGGAQPGRERTTLAPAQRITLKAAADTGHERKTERSARAARFCTTGTARADTRDEAGQQQTHVKMSDPTNAQSRGARVPAAGGGCDGCAGAPGSARDGMRAGVGRGRPPRARARHEVWTAASRVMRALAMAMAVVAVGERPPAAARMRCEGVSLPPDLRMTCARARSGPYNDEDLLQYAGAPGQGGERWRSPPRAGSPPLGGGYMGALVSGGKRSRSAERRARQLEDEYEDERYEEERYGADAIAGRDMGLDPHSEKNRAWAERAKAQRAAEEARKRGRALDETAQEEARRVADTTKAIGTVAGAAAEDVHMMAVLPPTTPKLTLDEFLDGIGDKVITSKLPNDGADMLKDARRWNQIPSMTIQAEKPHEGYHTTTAVTVPVAFGQVATLLQTEGIEMPDLTTESGTARVKYMPRAELLQMLKRTTGARQYEDIAVGAKEREQYQVSMRRECTPAPCSPHPACARSARASGADGVRRRRRMRACAGPAQGVPDGVGLLRVAGGVQGGGGGDGAAARHVAHPAHQPQPGGRPLRGDRLQRRHHLQDVRRDAAEHRPTTATTR